MFLKKQKSSDTENFYQKLNTGKFITTFWGKKSRFDPEAISKKNSVNRHFLPIVSQYVTKNDICLDFGCGPGGFLQLIAPLSKSVMGADITPSFIEECQRIINLNLLTNALTTIIYSDKPLPFLNNSFDKVFLIDTIHHLEDPIFTLSEISRVLKKDGHLIIFEPNIYNPLLALLCFFDKNEHGLLKLGTFNSYEKLLSNKFTIEEKKFNGMLVGPESIIFQLIANLVSNSKFFYLNWLSPKIFIVAKKNV